MSSLKSSALVVGLGATGMSCVRYLTRSGYVVHVVDSRDDPPNQTELQTHYPEVALHTGSFASEFFAAVDLIVVSPGVSLHEPAIRAVRERDIEVVGDIELFARAAQAPVLAVTGSNGKSTVTALVGEMCRAHGLAVEVAGNIGVPVLDLLAPEVCTPDVYVLELSSFQLETTSRLNAAAAIILNISSDHMDRYASMSEYLAAKARIYRGGGRVVVNRSDALTRDLAPPHRDVVSIGLDLPPTEADFGIRVHRAEEWLSRGTERLIRATDVPLTGRHNLLNVLAAMAVAQTINVSSYAMTAAVKGFRGLPHRLELVAEHNGVRWINDSKATNVGATVAALNSLDGPVVLIAGGQSKGADFSPLHAAVRDKARAVVLFGQDHRRIARAIRDAVSIHHVRDLREAVSLAAVLAQSGDSVLLSPACASFDMFQNFAHRGETFCKLVVEQLP